MRIITLFKYSAAIILGLSSGAVIAGAVFAFIAILGIVPRLAQKTDTTAYIILYEEAIIIGGILGVCAQIFNISLPMGKIIPIIFSLFAGIFWGGLAMSLAEVLDVMPILTRRMRIEKFMYIFIFAIAIGKVMASLMYFMIPGFFVHP